MPTSYDGTLLEHLPEHMYLSTASSFWFSLNSSYDHGCHLSKQMGLSPQDYECLLVAANLALFHQKRGFSTKILKWKLILKGHLFATTNCTDTVERHPLVLLLRQLVVVCCLPLLLASLPRVPL
jgi:hypothetical protein